MIEKREDEGGTSEVEGLGAEKGPRRTTEQPFSETQRFLLLLINNEMRWEAIEIGKEKHLGLGLGDENDVIVNRTRARPSR